MKNVKNRLKVLGLWCCRYEDTLRFIKYFFLKNIFKFDNFRSFSNETPIDTPSGQFLVLDSR